MEKNKQSLQLARGNLGITLNNVVAKNYEQKEFKYEK